MKPKKCIFHLNRHSDFSILTCEIENSLTAVRKDFSFEKLFCDCFKLCTKRSHYHVVRLNIKFSGNKYERIVELMTQCGVFISQD